MENLQKSELTPTNLRYVVIQGQKIIFNNEDQLVVELIGLGGYKLSTTYYWHQLNKPICNEILSSTMISGVTNVGILVDKNNVIMAVVKGRGEVVSCINELKDKNIQIVKS